MSSSFSKPSSRPIESADEKRMKKTVSNASKSSERSNRCQYKTRVQDEDGKVTIVACTRENVHEKYKDDCMSLCKQHLKRAFLCPSACGGDSYDPACPNCVQYCDGCCKPLCHDCAAEFVCERPGCKTVLCGACDCIHDEDEDEDADTDKDKDAEDDK